MAAKPLSKTADVWDWRDIINFIILASGGGAGLVFPENIWHIVLVSLPAILFMVAGIKAQYKVNKYETKPKPNLEIFGQPYIEDRIIYVITTSKETVSRQAVGKPHFAHVKFRNAPKIRSPEANAKRVIAEITYYDSNGVEKLPLRPDGIRFGGITQPPYQDKGKPRHEYHEIEFNANGYAHELTIAMKYEEDEYCYAYDDLSYGYSDWRKPKYKLEGNDFYIKVNLNGENIQQGEWWFKLHNKGIGDSMKLDSIPAPTF